LGFLFLKERLLNFPVNVLQPIFGTNGTVAKMTRLSLEFSHSLFGRPKPRREMTASSR
jgi:hypothetical protein